MLDRFMWTNTAEGRIIHRHKHTALPRIDYNNYPVNDISPSHEVVHY